MKDIIDKISVTTILLLYLFFCGTIYLISFWSTFDFDITNYIELLDIPKSFVFPLATGLGVSLLTLLIQGVQHSIAKVQKDEIENEKLLPKIKELPTRALFFRILNDYHTWLIAILLICLFCYRLRREWVFAISSLSLAIFGVVKFIREPTTIKKIPNYRVRLFVCVLFVVIPLLSFNTGKQDAIAIWKNRKYFRITNIVFKEKSLSTQNPVQSKLLGKLGTYLFVSDSLNSRITILNLETINSIDYKLIDRRSDF